MAADETTPIADRTTAPQSPYTIRQVGIGLLILAIGSVIVFGIPLAYGMV